MPEEAIVNACRDLVRRVGLNKSAKALKMPRETIASIAAGAAVRAGTIALARERLAALETAAPLSSPPPRAA
jgi:hypothetical protein